MDDEKLIENALDAAWPNWRGKYQETNNHTRDQMRAAIAVIRPAVIEECAETVRRYRQRYGGNWPALENVEVEIRALAAPRAEQEGEP